MANNQLDPLTNLPEKNKNLDITFSPLSEAPTKRVSKDTPINLGQPYEFNTYKFDPNKDRYVQRGMNQESYRASNQSVATQAANSFFGGLVSALGTAMEDVGYMADIDNNVKLLAGLEHAETNWFSNWGTNLKNWTNEKMPIYRKDPNQFFDLNDWGSYFSAGKSLIDNAVGFALPGAGAVKALSFAQKLSKYARLFRVSKATAQLVNAVGAGYLMNVGESKMMAIETFNNTKNDLMQNYHMSEAEATERAGQAARDMYLWNKAFLATNIFEVAGLSRMEGFTRNLIKSEDLLSPMKRYKKALGTWSSDNLILQGLGEYGEEVGQGIMQSEAQYQASKDIVPKQDGTDLFLRAINTFTSGQTQLEGILGFLGGAGQRVMSSAFTGKGDTKKLQEQYKVQQDLIAETVNFVKNNLNSQKELSDIMQGAALQQDDHMLQLVRRTNLTKTAVKNFQQGTTESLIRLLEDRVEAGEDGAQNDLDFVKGLEKQWVSDTRYNDPSIQPRVFHTRESLKMANDRLAYLNDKLTETEQAIVKSPADGTLRLKADQFKNEVDEMKLVGQELEKALKEVTSIKYGLKVEKARKEFIAKLETKKAEAIALAKEKKRREESIGKAKKFVKEGFTKVKSLYQKGKEQLASKWSKSTEPVVTEEAVVEEAIKPVESAVSTKTADTVEKVKPRRKAKKKAKKDFVAEEQTTELPLDETVPPATTTSTDIDALLKDEAHTSAIENETQTLFAEINTDGSVTTQENILGNELSSMGVIEGNVMEVILTPGVFGILKSNLANQGLLENSDGPKLQFGEEFKMISNPIYNKIDGEWVLMQRGIYEKVEEDLTEQQKEVQSLALKINALLGEESDEMAAEISTAKKLELMQASTELFKKAADIILANNPAYDFNSPSAFFAVMNEISTTVPKKVMENIFPYIKGFYAPTFQVDPNVATKINEIKFDDIFLTEEEIAQLLQNVDTVYDTSLPSDMLTEDKLILSEEFLDELKDNGIVDDVKLTEHEGLEPQYSLVDNPANHLGYLNLGYTQTVHKGKVYRDDNGEVIDEYDVMLDDSIVHVGAEFGTTVIDDNEMPMYLPGGAENEMTTWGEIKTHMQDYLDYYGFKTEEELYNAFVPIGIMHNGKVIAYIHNIEFINPLRVEGSAANRQAEAQKLLKIRKSILSGTVKKVVITEKFGGRILINAEPVLLETVIPKESNDSLSLGIMKEGQIVGHNVSEVKTIINEDKIYPGVPYIFVPVQNGWMGIVAQPGKLDQETAESLVNAIIIAMHKGELSPEVQTMVNEIKSVMKIDITSEKGLFEYLSHFLYNFSPNAVFDNFKEQGFRSPLDAYIKTAGATISSGHRFINFSGNSVDFGIGNASQTFSLSKETDPVMKEKLKSLLLQHLQGMYLNISVNKLSENKKTPIVLITKDGLKTINGDGTYLDFIKKGLNTRVEPIISGEKTYFRIQPKVMYDVVYEEAQVEDKRDLIKSITPEPDTTVTSGEKAFETLQYIKDTPGNRTRVAKKVKELDTLSDAEITNITLNGDGYTLTEREAARQIFFARNLNQVKENAGRSPNPDGTFYSETIKEKDNLTVTTFTNFRADGREIAGSGKIMSVSDLIEEYNITDENDLDILNNPDLTIKKLVVREVRKSSEGNLGITIRVIYEEGGAIEYEIKGSTAEKITTKPSEDLRNELGFGKKARPMLDDNMEFDDMINLEQKELSVDNKCKI